MYLNKYPCAVFLLPFKTAQTCFVPIAFSHSLIESYFVTSPVFMFIAKTGFFLFSFSFLTFFKLESQSPNFKA